MCLIIIGKRIKVVERGNNSFEYGSNTNFSRSTSLERGIRRGNRNNSIRLDDFGVDEESIDNGIIELRNFEKLFHGRINVGKGEKDRKTREKFGSSEFWKNCWEKLKSTWSWCDKRMPATVRAGLPHSGGANLLNSEAGVGGNRRLSLVSFKWSLSGLPAFPLIAHYNRINNTSREVTEGDAYYTETCERNSLAVLVVSILTAISFFLSLSGDFRFLVNFHPRCFQQYVQLFVKLEFNYDSSVIEDDFVLISFVSC